ncbi:MAG TPA: serine hydrolase domain-containing protein, partial [Haliscomenobacter sp.]|uniref:serine hydrolase domain-containing protein n=1 Tax=Haliscomenobacter sp. TaxID=2717303 RepID=UPI002BA9D25E
MLHTAKIYLLLLLLSLLSFNSFAQQSRFQDTIQKIDALFTQWDTHTPGGVLTVSRQGKIIYNYAFGMADLEHNLANTTESVFEAGSVSKQFTAAAILLLVQDGKLSLDDDIRKYLPEIPDYGVTIKIRHLMTHTSGLRDWGSVAAISGWARGKRTHTHAHVLEILSRQKALNFPPGDQYSYCNSGYNLMAIIVDRVSGMSFAEFCTQRMFKPMGLKNTQWRDDYRKIVPNRAIAYSKSGDTYLQNMPFEMVHGNGGLLTTTADLVTWNQLYNTLIIGNKTFAEQRLITYKYNNGVMGAYAAGLSIGKYNNLVEISHSGATAGYRAWLAYYPEKDLSVAFLSNTANVNPVDMGVKAAAVFLGERVSTAPMLGTIVPDEKSLQAKAGLYRSVRNDNVMQLEVKDGLLRSTGGQVLQATAENTFFQGSNRMAFLDKKFILYAANGDSTSYLKKEPFHPTEKDLQAFMGTYHSAEADATFEVIWKGGKLQTFLKPDMYQELTPFYKNAFENEN